MSDQTHPIATPAPEPAPPVVLPAADPAQVRAPQPRIAPAGFGPAPALDPFGRPIPRQRKRSRLRERASAIGAAIIAFVAKFKLIILALTKIKFLVTGASAVVSIAAYSLFFGWEFAVGFVILMFVHEMGHVIAARREGIPVTAPMFIPFLGAAIFAKSLGDNALAEARVGLAGPVLGSLGAGLVALAAALTGSGLLQALAYTGFFLNLFNLVPVVPFDGGRAMAAMAPSFWLVGFLGMLGLGLYTGNPLVVAFAALGGYEGWKRWKQIRLRTLVTAAYYRVSPRNRMLVGGVYVSLILALGFGMYATYVSHAVGFAHY